ncbi:hypothetical protein Tco_1034620, partial [Tanacetum coccineum]
PKGQIVNKFLKQKELLPHMLKGKEEGALRQSNELQARLTPTPRVWRLYLSKEAVKEGSGVGMIQLGLDEKIYSYAIRLNFDTLDHNMYYEALLEGLVEGSRTAAKKEARKYEEEIMDAALEFVNQEVSVGIKTRPSVKVGSDGKEGKATSKVPIRMLYYNWETSGSN